MLHPVGVAFLCGFAAGTFVYATLSKKESAVEDSSEQENLKTKTPVADRTAWKSIFQKRLMAAYSAAMTLDEETESEKLMDMGQKYFGPEAWTIGHHQYKDPEW